VPVIWFVRHLVMLKSFKNFDNLKPWNAAAEIIKFFWFGTNLGQLT